MKNRVINLKPGVFELVEENGKPVMVFEEYRYDINTKVTVRVHIDNYWFEYITKAFGRYINKKIDHWKNILRNSNDGLR